MQRIEADNQEEKDGKPGDVDLTLSALSIARHCAARHRITDNKQYGDEHNDADHLDDDRDVGHFRPHCVARTYDVGHFVNGRTGENAHRLGR